MAILRRPTASLHPWAASRWSRSRPCSNAMRRRTGRSTMQPSGASSERPVRRPCAVDQVEHRLRARRNPRTHRAERRRQDHARQRPVRISAAALRRDRGRDRDCTGCRVTAFRAPASFEHFRRCGFSAGMSVSENIEIGYVGRGLGRAEARRRAARYACRIAARR